MTPASSRSRSSRPRARWRPIRSFRRVRSSCKPDFRAFGWATLAVLVAVVISHVADRFLPLANLSLIFLMAVLVVAIRFGLWPSVYTSLLSFFVYNFFFTEPHHTFLRGAPGRRTDGRLLPGGRGHRRQPGGAAQGAGRGDASDHPAHRQPLRLQPQDRGRRCAQRRPLGGRASCRIDPAVPVSGAAAARRRPARDRIGLPARRPDVADRVGRRALGVAARPGGRLELGHAAGLGMAVPAAQDRAWRARPAWRLRSRTRNGS